MSNPPFTSSDRLWSVFCHLSFFFGVGVLAFVFPLVVYLVMRHDSPYVGHHAREALNFHLSILLYAVLCIPLCIIVIGVAGFIVLGLVGTVLSIIAAVHASDGTYYKYPMTIRFVHQ